MHGRTSEHAESDVGDRLHDLKQSAGALIPAAGGEREALLLAISAGLIVGGGALPINQMIMVIITFMLLGASRVLVPVIGYLIASAQLAGRLDELRE
jgi:hypothetical protein